MGYSTKFAGQFDLDEQLTLDQFNEVKTFHDKEHNQGYCQWVPTTDGRGIKWDGEEKFYDYDMWLQRVIDEVLTPMGRTLSGSVQWAGEDAEDVGVLSVVDGKVFKQKLVPEGVKTQCPECDHVFYAKAKP